MADTTTTNIKLTNQTEGGNSNTWGGILDDNFEEIDDKFGDVTAISTTGGNTTLTDSQEIVNAIVVSGTLVANAVILFSGRGGTWIVRNATTGSYAVTCKVSGQTGVEITQGSTQPVFSTGTDIAAAGASSAATSIPAGAVMPYVAISAPTGWVRANGRTIGNAASSATERANADTATLYALLWDGFSNTVLPIQDSAGTATTRGASATVDYAANKRLPLPDLRGRSWFGLDDMGNSPASRLGTIVTSATTNGSSGGSETVTLADANVPAHTHTLAGHTHPYSSSTGSTSTEHTHTVSITSGSTTDTHSHTYSGTTVGAGSDHTHTFSATTSGFSNDHTHSVSGTTSTDPGHTHPYGGSNPLSASSGSSPNTANNGSDYTTGTGGSHSHSFSATTSGVSSNHTHTVSGTTSGHSLNHTHTYSGTTTTHATGHTHTVSGTSGAMSANASHTHTVSGTTSSGGDGVTGSFGSGTAHSNMPPAWLGTWIIKL